MALSMDNMIYCLLFAPGDAFETIQEWLPGLGPLPPTHQLFFGSSNRGLVYSQTTLENREIYERRF